jgi:hypothetical protein
VHGVNRQRIVCEWIVNGQWIDHEIKTVVDCDWALNTSSPRILCCTCARISAGPIYFHYLFTAYPLSSVSTRIHRLWSLEQEVETNTAEGRQRNVSSTSRVNRESTESQSRVNRESIERIESQSRVNRESLLVSRESTVTRQLVVRSDSLACS